MSALDLFPQFPALPSELRLAIWKHSLSSILVVSFRTQEDADETADVGQPVLSIDKSLIARSCKEAWEVMRESHIRVRFGAVTPGPFSFVAWIDFSSTVFHLGHGEFSFGSIHSLTPSQISERVQRVSIAWSSYRELIETCKRLDVFQGLKRIVIMPDSQGGADGLGRNADAIGRANDSATTYRGSVPPVRNLPLVDEVFLEEQVERFVERLFRRLGRKGPTIEIVALNQ